MGRLRNYIIILLYTNTYLKLLGERSVTYPFNDIMECCLTNSPNIQYLPYEVYTVYVLDENYICQDAV